MTFEGLKLLPADKQKEEFDRIDKIRQVYKIANYSLMYSSGADNLARSAKISVAEAKKIKQAYWRKNWSIRKISASFDTKETSTGKWVQNPTSGFWHVLRSEKDRFSTINSSTGVYCFDLFVHNVLSKRPYGYLAQFHDEVILQVKKGYREEVKKLLQDSIDKVNREVKLNVELKIDINFGDRYSEVH